MTKIDNPEIFVYKDLREKILTGEFKNGYRLIETALTAQYGVSRLHIKSALRLLEQEQLAEHIMMRGFQVKGFTPEAMEEVSELRLALDSVTFVRFVKVASQEDVALLRKVAQRVAVFFENNMVEDAMEELDRFYAFVYEKSGYTHITVILDKYSDYFKIIRRHSSADQKLNLEAAQLLFEIMTAIEHKDTDTLIMKLGER